MGDITLRELKERMFSFGKHLYDENIEVFADDPTSFRCRMYTDNNVYAITATATDQDRSDGYLGCIASSRKPRAGETWTRGNDLADGDLTEETWIRILGDIVAYELVKVHKQKV